MARFFMAMNGKRINTLEELRANFNREIISFYRGGRLLKWLEEIGNTNELKDIKSFTEGYDDDTLFSMLMGVFDLSDEQIAKIKKVKENSNQNKVIEERTNDYVVEKAYNHPLTTSLEKEYHWFCGRMHHPNCSNMENASCEAIAESALRNIKDPSGNDELSIERIFFWGGYFFAILNIYGDDASETVIVQSSDLRHWTKNVVMSDLGYSFGSSSNGIASGNEHCFVFSTSKLTDKKEIFIGTSVSDWKKIDLFLPDCEIIDIFEKNKEIGIFYSSSKKSGVLLADSIFAISKRKFRDIEFPQGISSTGISSCFIFKNYCFYRRGGKFCFADMENWNFEPVKYDWKAHNASAFSFDEIVFIVIRPWETADAWSVYYSADGTTWQEIEFDFGGVPPAKIFKAGNAYYALSENEGGYCNLFYSTNGIDWTQRTTICCSGYFLVGESGNDKVVLTTGGNEYLFYSIL